jgi:hypothetical protein
VIIPVEGPPPDIDCSQEGMGSQVIDEMETDAPIGNTRTVQQEMPIRNSSRLAAHPDINVRVEDGARQMTATRNISSLNSSADQEIIRRGADGLINAAMGARTTGRNIIPRIEDARISRVEQADGDRNNVQAPDAGNEDNERQ